MQSKGRGAWSGFLVQRQHRRCGAPPHAFGACTFGQFVVPLTFSSLNLCHERWSAYTSAAHVLGPFSSSAGASASASEALPKRRCRSWRSSHCCPHARPIFCNTARPAASGWLCWASCAANSAAGSARELLRAAGLCCARARTTVKSGRPQAPFILCDQPPILGATERTRAAQSKQAMDVTLPPMPSPDDTLMDLSAKESTPAMCDSQLMSIESQEEEQTRFQVELEFVQCLANPRYLHCLSLLSCSLSASVAAQKTRRFCCAVGGQFWRGAGTLTTPLL